MGSPETMEGDKDIGYWETTTLITPWKINMEPEPKNHPIEKESHLPNHHFQVPC